jgi:hypothetical protein
MQVMSLLRRLTGAETNGALAWKICAAGATKCMSVLSATSMNWHTDDFFVRHHNTAADAEYVFPSFVLRE